MQFEISGLMYSVRIMHYIGLNTTLHMIRKHSTRLMCDKWQNMHSTTSVMQVITDEKKPRDQAVECTGTTAGVTQNSNRLACITRLLNRI